MDAPPDGIAYESHNSFRGNPECRLNLVERSHLQVRRTLDKLCLVEAVDRFGQRVVAAVADAADRRIDPGFGQAIGNLAAKRPHLAVGLPRAPRTPRFDPASSSRLNGVVHLERLAWRRSTASDS